MPLLPLWAVRPVRSLSACTRVHFNLLTLSVPSRVKAVPETTVTNYQITVRNTPEERMPQPRLLLILIPD